MNSKNKKTLPPKRGFPGGFLLFFLVAILLILTFQNLSHDKVGKVGFSHQVEHVVNLDLIQKDESRKTALNDNLVSFSGKFKQQLSDESKNRFRYLELLNDNHGIQESRGRLATGLDALETSVRDAADRFLHLSGMTLPEGGYQVVSPFYDTGSRENAIVLKSLSQKNTINLPEVTAQFHRLTAQPSHESAKSLGRDLQLLIQSFKSSALGIGSDKIKQQLKKIDEEVTQVQSLSLTPLEQATVYRTAIETLDEVVKELNTPVDHIRLTQLRSVRNYMLELEQYNLVSNNYEKNQAELNKARQNVADVSWFFNNKELSTRALEKQDPEEFSRWFVQSKLEWMNFASNQGASFKAPDQPRNLVLEKTFKSQEPAPNYVSYIFTILPVVLVILLLYFVFSRQMKGMGSSAMNFGKSPAKLLNRNTNKVTFKEVAGVDEAKEELQEIVDFLKDPAKFTALGARIPKGVLCIGPPGTGKTLIAKAVAGEADRPFFSISGSDFVEMFVGVGASRIRDLFDQAKKSAPCIIFIDEIDAVGRHRGAGIGGGHDEREQTLNQLLVEMDGFDTNEGVILMAATNRPDVLDKALLRPGRFDRQIILNLPDIKGRLEILKVHAHKIKMDPSMDLMLIARNTPGASGADLMNILNEAALAAARKGKLAVTTEDALEACDKVRYGKERRSLELDKQEKLNTAYHESGHAIVALSVQHSDPVEKITIIPRGMSLGATHFIPEKNRVSYWKKELHDRLAVLMGGRVAEEIFLGDISSGAQMDISQATRLARSMVCEWGMTDSLGAVAYDEHTSEGQYFMPGQHERSYSDNTAKSIDDEVRKIVDSANTRATEIIQKHKDKVKQMAELLLEFESLDKEDVHAIMDGKWSSDKKREKLKLNKELQCKPPPPPPKKKPLTDIDPTPQGI